MKADFYIQALFLFHSFNISANPALARGLSTIGKLLAISLIIEGFRFLAHCIYAQENRLS
jgi:hypothetical protein